MKNKKQQNIKQKFQINHGIYKGCTLFLESNETTRPTKALVKKSFFDTLHYEIQDKIFIECFAGSGQMGFEALSAGAKKVVFFEQDKRAFQNLQRNISLFQDKIHSTMSYQTNNTRDCMNLRDYNTESIKARDFIDSINSITKNSANPKVSKRDSITTRDFCNTKYSLIDCYCMDFFTSQKLLESYLQKDKNSDLENKKANFETKNAIMPNLLLHKVQQLDKMILYFDPPFSCRKGFDDIYTQIVHFIESLSKSLLQQVDIIVIEKMSDARLDEKLGFFSLQKMKTFGKTSLAYFNRTEE